MQAGLGFEDFAHFDAVELLVALGAGTPDGGAAGGVEEAELDADGVGDLAHDAAEGVDFADQVAFGDAADGRIAGHLGDQVEVHGDDRGLEPHARGGHGGFAAGVARADDGDVVLFGKTHSLSILRSFWFSVFARLMWLYFPWVQNLEAEPRKVPYIARDQSQVVVKR